MKIYSKVIFTKDFSQAEIQGNIQNGSIAIDGNSSTRRIMRLTMVSAVFDFEAKDLLDKEVEAYVGIEDDFNHLSWFKVGIYILSDLNVSVTNTGYQISLTAKDKSCRLNGTLGGVFPAITTLHEDAEYQEVLIYDIVKAIVQVYGNIDHGKIFINDLDTKVKQVLSYKGNKPFYFELDRYDEYSGNFIIADYPNAKVSKPYRYGENVGYIYVPFTYPGELVAAPGETVISVLDKIKQVLGNYEYFFDVDGNFIFQEIKNYLNTSQSTLLLSEVENVDINYYKSKAKYKFTDDMLENINYTPDLANLKNDFVIWGKNKNDTNICYHLAIDKKPEVPSNYSYDWREYLYERCLLDDYQYSYYKPEMLSFWRTIYNPYRYIGYYEGEEHFTNEPRGFHYEDEEQSDPFHPWDECIDNEEVLKWEEIWNENVDKNTYGEWNGWNPDVILNPSALIYWIDFLNVDYKYSISNIGRRSYIKQEDDVTSLFNAKVPDIVFINKDDFIEEEELQDEIQQMKNKGQTFCCINNIESNYFDHGNLRNDAYSLVRDLLYQYTIVQNKISITHIPIYDLEVNTIMELQSEKLPEFNGYYLIDSTNIPLNFNGTMTTSASKLLERV